MTQEEKQLLLIDLCARLPYGVICKDQYGDYIDVNIYNAHIEHLIDQILSGVIQMTLRSMSSMTEEEKKEYENCYQSDDTTTATLLIDFYNKKYFDYRGLIEKGLALNAPEGMYIHFRDMKTTINVEYKGKF